MHPSAKSKQLRLTVSPETARMLRLGHPWVIADRQTARWPQAACGALAELADDQGEVLGTALLEPGARVVARHPRFGIAEPRLLRVCPAARPAN